MKQVGFYFQCLIFSLNFFSCGNKDLSEKHSYYLDDFKVQMYNEMINKVVGNVYLSESLDSIKINSKVKSNMPKIDLPKRIKKNIFKPLELDKNVIECKIGIFSNPAYCIDMFNRTDSLEYLMFISKEETKIYSVNDLRKKEILEIGRLNQIRIVPPGSIDNSIVIPPSITGDGIKDVFYFRKTVTFKKKDMIIIELFVKNRDNEKVM